MILVKNFCVSVIPGENLLTALRSFSVLMICLCAGVVAICWEATTQEAIFCAVCGYTVQNILSNVRTLSGYFFGYGLGKGLCQVVVPVVLLPVIWFFWIRRLKKGFEEPALKTSLFGLCAMLAACIILPSELFKYDFGIYAQNIAVIVNSVCILLCLALLEAQINAVENRRIQVDNQRLSWLLNERQTQYETSSATMELINIKCHDLKHYLSSHQPAGILETGMDEEIQQVVDFFDTQYNTGCKALDIVLGEKAIRCMREGIPFECMADGTKMGFMSPIDTYTLFENVLQNAIEATIQCVPEERVISLQIKQKQGFLMIVIENSCVTIPQMRDGIPQTTKPDKSNHGFGVISIQMIVQKYQGTVQLGGSNGIFSVSIMIPMNQEC